MSNLDVLPLAVLDAVRELGIQLMPRIRNWKDLRFYRPDSDSDYEHIYSLFQDEIDWDRIETMLPDMLRVALSVKKKPGLSVVLHLHSQIGYICIILLRPVHDS